MEPGVCRDDEEIGGDQVEAERQRTKAGSGNMFSLYNITSRSEQRAVSLLAAGCWLLASLCQSMKLRAACHR